MTMTIHVGSTGLMSEGVVFVFNGERIVKVDWPAAKRLHNELARALYIDPVRDESEHIEELIAKDRTIAALRGALTKAKARKGVA
jgi:hypothetical protein